MDETATKVPVTEEKPPEGSTESQARRPFESLRLAREMNPHVQSRGSTNAR
jgi:hypothetical protein